MGDGEKITRFRFDPIILEKKDLSPRLARLIHDGSWFDIIDDANQGSRLTVIRAESGEEFVVATQSIDRFYRAGDVECSE